MYVCACVCERLGSENVRVHTLLQHVLAGGRGGCAAALRALPLEVVLAQQRSPALPLHSCAAVAAALVCPA